MAEITVHYDGPLVSRRDARERGDKRFFTGEPCKLGHVAQRFVTSCVCLVCNRVLHRHLHAAWRKENPEKLREYSRKHYAKPGTKEKRHERYMRRREEELRVNRAWADANKERKLALQRRWVKDNPEKYRAQGMRRRRRVKQVPGSGIEPFDIMRLMELQGGKCAECSARLSKTKWEVDHIVPLARGGEDDPRNAQILCRSCNRSKGARDPIEHAQRKGRLL